MDKQCEQEIRGGIAKVLGNNCQYKQLCEWALMRNCTPMHCKAPILDEIARVISSADSRQSGRE
jgi:hypothetical protein